MFFGKWVKTMNVPDSDPNSIQPVPGSYVWEYKAGSYSARVMVKPVKPITTVGWTIYGPDEFVEFGRVREGSVRELENLKYRIAARVDGLVVSPLV